MTYPQHLNAHRTDYYTLLSGCKNLMFPCCGYTENMLYLWYYFGTQKFEYQKYQKYQKQLTSIIMAPSPIKEPVRIRRKTLANVNLSISPSTSTGAGCMSFLNCILSRKRQRLTRSATSRQWLSPTPSRRSALWIFRTEHMASRGTTRSRRCFTTTTTHWPRNARRKRARAISATGHHVSGIWKNMILVRLSLSLTSPRNGCKVSTTIWETRLRLSAVTTENVLTSVHFRKTPSSHTSTIYGDITDFTQIIEELVKNQNKPANKVWPSGWNYFGCGHLKIRAEKNLPHCLVPTLEFHNYDLYFPPKRLSLDRCSCHSRRSRRCLQDGKVWRWSDYGAWSIFCRAYP